MIKKTTKRATYIDVLCLNPDVVYSKHNHLLIESQKLHLFSDDYFRREDYDENS